MLPRRGSRNVCCRAPIEVECRNQGGRARANRTSANRALKRKSRLPVRASQNLVEPLQSSCLGYGTLRTLPLRSRNSDRDHQAFSPRALLAQTKTVALILAGTLRDPGAHALFDYAAPDGDK